MAKDNESQNSAKSALADYYDDLLGSLSGSPLPKTEVKEPSLSPEVHVKKNNHDDAIAITNSITAEHTLESKGSSFESDALTFQDHNFQTQYHSLKNLDTNTLSKRPNYRADDDPAGLGALRQATQPHAEPATLSRQTIRTKFPKLAPPKVQPAEVTKTTPKIKALDGEQAVKPDLENLEHKESVETSVNIKANPDLKKDVEPRVSSTPEMNEPSQLDEAVMSSAINSKDEEQAIKAPVEWCENGRPLWAQERFDCLLFSVAGLKLAVPLVSLGSIHKLEEDLTPLVGRADWFIGLYRTGDRNIQVVDTAKWVMPNRYHEEVLNGYEFLIRLGDSNWGLACDSVAQAVQLEPTQVKWRSERSKRPWLSGTVIDHMCALLDADTLNYMLYEGAQVRR